MPSHYAAGLEARARREAGRMAAGLISTAAESPAPARSQHPAPSQRPSQRPGPALALTLAALRPAPLALQSWPLCAAHTLAAAAIVDRLEADYRVRSIIHLHLQPCPLISPHGPPCHVQPLSAPAPAPAPAPSGAQVTGLHGRVQRCSAAPHRWHGTASLRLGSTRTGAPTHEAACRADVKGTSRAMSRALLTPQAEAIRAAQPCRGRRSQAGGVTVAPSKWHHARQAAAGGPNRHRAWPADSRVQQRASSSQERARSRG
jgi:hypothetical protein